MQHAVSSVCEIWYIELCFAIQCFSNPKLFQYKQTLIYFFNILIPRYPNKPSNDFINFEGICKSCNVQNMARQCAQQCINMQEGNKIGW